MPEAVTIVLAALVGGLVTYIAQNFFSILSIDVAALNDHIDETRKIEELAVDYWLADTDMVNADIDALAARVEGALSASAFFRERAKKLCKSKFEDYAELDFRLYDNTTGGAFRQKPKVVDTKRVVEIMKVCNEMRAFLRESKRAIYWFH